MRTLFRRLIATLAVIILFAATAAHAQFCTAIRITNNTTCTLDLVFTNGLALSIIPNVTPGTASYPAPPAGFNSILTAWGNTVPLPPVGACTGCVTLRRSGATSFCCAQICATATCWLTINPVPCAATCL